MLVGLSPCALVAIPNHEQIPVTPWPANQVRGEGGTQPYGSVGV
jgi:hypothetical protein